MVGRCSGRSVLADERESSPAGSYSAADEDTLPGFKLVTLASYREVRAGGVRAAELATTCPVVLQVSPGLCVHKPEPRHACFACRPARPLSVMGEARFGQRRPASHGMAGLLPL
jgi:hypothetical protein